MDPHLSFLRVSVLFCFFLFLFRLFSGYLFVEIGRAGSCRFTSLCFRSRCVRASEKEEVVKEAGRENAGGDRERDQHFPLRKIWALSCFVSKRGKDAIPSRQARGGQWALNLHQCGFQVLYDISSEAHIRVVFVITPLRVLPVSARMRIACVWLSEWDYIHLQLQAASALNCTYKWHA